MTKLHPAFEQCAGFDCEKVELDAPPANPTKEATRNHVRCRSGKNCKPPCRCRAFMRKAGAAEDAVWEFAFPDSDADIDRQAGYDYQCFCVQPVLPEPWTPCSNGNCTIMLANGNAICRSDGCEEHGGLGMQGILVHTPVKCGCELFRLKVGQDTKWEHVGKATVAKPVKREAGFYYQCFCAASL